MFDLRSIATIQSAGGERAVEEIVDTALGAVVTADKRGDDLLVLELHDAVDDIVVSRNKSSFPRGAQRARERRCFRQYYSVVSSTVVVHLYIGYLHKPDFTRATFDAAGKKLKGHADHSTAS